MYPWMSRTLDFGLQFCEKSAAYTLTFTVFIFHYEIVGEEGGEKCPHCPFHYTVRPAHPSLNARTLLRCIVGVLKFSFGVPTLLLLL